MKFVDNTGHIFSLPSYKEKPIGYEYEEYSYVFWIDSTSTSKLSVNNYYSKPIYALYELSDNIDLDELKDDKKSPLDIEIYVENSNVFKLISSNDLQEYILSDKYNNINDYIDLNDYNQENSIIKSKLTNKDLYTVVTSENVSNLTSIDYLLIPIYPICMSTEDGTWITNIMIHINNKNDDTNEWCYFSVGGEFVNEYEELIINGKNQGVNLPKEIVKAIYSESLYNDEFNESLYNEKLKEYLLNIMSIKGECGNFNSVIHSLKWFGYGDKITLSKLLKTDNEFKAQYIRDYFNISNDVITSFKTFMTDSLISLMIMINKELDECYKFDTNKFFFGENKPKLQMLIDSYIKVKIGNHDMPIEDDDEKYWYWQPYFKFSFVELGIKLMCVKYYLKTYFLPIHLNIHKASLGLRVFANDIKFTNKIGYNITYPYISINNRNNDVDFIGSGIHYFTKQLHYVDDHFNEYELPSISNDNNDWYSINDTCVNIPIRFNKNEYYNCVLLLIKKNTNALLYESHFSFIQNDEYSYKNFIIYPKKLNSFISIKDDEVSVNSKYFEYWINSDFMIKLLVNNKWYEYDFKLKINKPTIDFGKLRYRYYLNEHNYLVSKIINKNIGDNAKYHSIIYASDEDIDKIRSTIINTNINIDETDIYKINDIIYNNLNLYDYHGDAKNTYINTIDFSDEQKLYQYFANNYNIYSPFKQLKNIDTQNHRIIFNSYMHNEKLVNMNNINFDINFYKILEYHLNNNLMYIDGTLLDNEFYQYIIYEYNGRAYEIIIHKDLIGEDITIPEHYLNMYDNVMICAWNENIYILAETGSNNDAWQLTKLSTLITQEANENDDTPFLSYDSLDFEYNKETKSYWKNGKEYIIYDKLHSNTEAIYSKYKSIVNLPNHLKYKNNMHLFGIYTTETHEKNKLIFHNDIDIYVNGIRFRHGKYIKSQDPNKEYESLKFYIDGTLNTTIDSRYPDIYGLEWINNTSRYFDSSLNDTPVETIVSQYGLYAKRNYKRYFDNLNSENCPKVWELEDIDEYDVNEFSYYLDEHNTKAYEGYYLTLEDFYINKQCELPSFILYDGMEIYIEDNKYYFDDEKLKDALDNSKPYKNLLKYEVEFLDQNNNVMTNVSLRNIQNTTYSKVKVTFYYNKAITVRNRFYSLDEFLSKHNELNPVIYKVDDKYYMRTSRYEKIELIKFDDKYQYFDNEENHIISNQNPSTYWYNVDNESIKSLPSYLNELERYAYDMSDASDLSIDDFHSYMQTYIEKNTRSRLSGQFVDDSDEVKYYYNNYLEKDLTGWKGKYRIELDTNLNDNNEIRIIVEVIDKNNNISAYINNINGAFELSGDEKNVKLYIQLLNSATNRTYPEHTIYFIPKLIHIYVDENRLTYNYEQCGGKDNPYINVKFLNKEYIYGNNNTEYIYNLYNDFFNLKFNIYDSYIEHDATINKNKLNVSLLESVFDINDAIKLTSYLDYDFYLMHDDKYWYGLYISQQTCDNIRNNYDLNIDDSNKEMEFFSKTLNYHYILRYERTSQEYLLNRLEFISSNGLNHFNNDDIICCYVHNNDMLPFNADISSKWSIKPMSIGMHNNMSYDSNGELTILSLPKQSSKYQKGYYKIDVRYSLDRDIQHQFKNTSTILVK